MVKAPLNFKAEIVGKLFILKGKIFAFHAYMVKSLPSNKLLLFTSNGEDHISSLLFKTWHMDGISASSTGSS